jgi:tetratricopeptide (TPR) repeat protein
MIRYLIIKLLFFVLLAYAQMISAESKNEECSKILRSIIMDTKLEKENQLNKWQNYQATCAEDSFYYIGQAQIYGLQDTGNAVNYINKLLKEKKISYTKDIMFFLGICCDAVYSLKKDNEALKVLTGLADILINDYKNSATGFFLKGCYFFHKNDFDSAEEYYKKAKELGKRNDDNFFQNISIRDLTIKRGAIIFYRQNEYKLCIAFYNKALALDEFGTLADSFASNAATRSLLKIGNCKDARKLMNLRQGLFPQIAQGKNFIELVQEYSQECEK